jgi:hypothetical protein
MGGIMTDEPTPQEYEQMLLLEDLESLYEEMDEIGVADLEEVRRWLDPPASDRAGGTPSGADRAALTAIRRLMEEHQITTRAQLEERIATLHAELDALGG